MSSAKMITALIVAMIGFLDVSLMPYTLVYHTAVAPVFV